MIYYEIYAWAECPYCKDAKELLIKKEEQFMFCCLDQSGKLLSFLKDKYQHTTVPMILQKDKMSNTVKFIGGYTDLLKYLEVE